MTRIADEVIEQLKSQVDIAELVGRSGVELKKAGGDLVGRCPFHDDDTPSLVVSPRKGLWHCMGACAAGGSVIDWVMRAERVSLRHAVELLRAGAVRQASGTSSSRVRLPAPIERDASDGELLAQVVDYYHARLLASPEALAYLRRRRIDDPEAIEQFRLGYADRSLGLRLPHKQVKAGAEMRGALERTGVYRASGHEHLAGSIVVPVSKNGIPRELYGRKIRDNLRAGTALHLYLPGPHEGVFNEEALAASSEIVLCESLIDALTLWCAGIYAVTSSYGTAGFTADHREAFSAYRVKRVLIAYDHDEPGDAAAASLARELLSSGIEALRVPLPYGADVNDVAVASENPREALGRLVRQARWMGAATPRSAPPSSAAVPSAADDRTEQAVEPPVSPSSSPGKAPLVVAQRDELVLETGPRRWRVRGIGETPTPGSLKVNVMVQQGERFHLDVVDLYAARGRSGYCAAAATELPASEEALRAEIGRVMLATEEARAAAAKCADVPGIPQMTGEEKDAALSLLGDPCLAERVAEAFRALGVVGEQDAALFAWLVLTSRLDERPLGAVIQSSSAAGKSTLAEAALSLVPAEHKVAYSAMTGQALYYLGDADLSHKVLSIAEEEGASRASYALKLLVSEGRLSIAAAGKDPLTGRLVTNTYEVRGPVALLMTTTAAELEPELANRLVVLAVDETRPQTRAVHKAQRHTQTLDGLVARVRREETTALHHNAQRLLAPLAVVNPHAPSLSFSDAATRHRRDHAKLLALIRAVALAHQYQRERKMIEVGNKAVTYVEATQSDVELATRLSEALLSSTTDEMAPSTRRLLATIAAHLSEKGKRRFTRRELREATGLSDSQLKVHLARLVDLEHVRAHHAGPATTYELDPSTYDCYRLAQSTDRPVGNDDQLVIGRFPAGDDNQPFTREDDNYDGLSACSGSSGSKARKLSAASADAGEKADRPVSRRLHVLGEGANGAVVVEGTDR